MEEKNQQKTKLLPNSREKRGQECNIGNKNHIYLEFV